MIETHITTCYRGSYIIDFMVLGVFFIDTSVNTCGHKDGVNSDDVPKWHRVRFPSGR